MPTGKNWQGESRDHMTFLPMGYVKFLNNSCGADRDRTDDLMTASHALSQTELQPLWTLNITLKPFITKKFLKRLPTCFGTIPSFRFTITRRSISTADVFKRKFFLSPPIIIKSNSPAGFKSCNRIPLIFKLKIFFFRKPV